MVGRLCGRKAVWSCMCGRKYNSVKKISIAPNMNQNIYIYIQPISAVQKVSINSS